MATKRVKTGSSSAFDTYYETERHFKNVDYGEKLPKEPISPEEEEKRKQLLKDHIKSFVETIVKQYPPEKFLETGDFSAYTGSCGVALMFFRLYERHKNANSNDTTTSDYYLAMTRKYAEISEKIYTPSKRKPKEYVAKILEFLKWVPDNSFESDELLYGRAGLLYSLMFVNKYLKEDSIHAACVDIAKVILKRGKMYVIKQWKSYWMKVGKPVSIDVPMAWEKEIMNDEQYKSDIIQSIDFLASQEFPSGNYPNREGSSTDELVQWCHGCTAVAILFCKAEKLLKETRWRQKAQRAANCIWKRGLLKKGLGLCHGISGNGYVLLNMFNLTQDPMYFEQAWTFCEFSWSEKGVLTYNTPDEPYSLANGLAGAVTFYLDMLDPPSCNWIGFDV